MAVLKKITKLKNLGIFNDFTWTRDLPELKKYNIIYGWNGSGKSTLSKFLGALNAGEHPDFTNLEYSILDSDGNSHTQGSSFSTPIRVFNSDFISDNVDFESQSSKAITVVLGEENKDALKEIKEDEESLKDLERDIEAKEKEHLVKTNARGSEFSNIAKVISPATQGLISSNYNKTNAEKAFLSLNQKNLLSEEELAKLTKSVSQDTLPKILELSYGSVKGSLASIITRAKELLQQTVEAVVIERLKDNPDISSWVETGLSLHKEHGSKNCEFCGSPLETKKLTELAAHFNEADAKLKAEVERLVQELRRVSTTVEEIQLVDKTNLYQEYRDDYQEKTNEVAKTKEAFLVDLTKLEEIIKSKKQHTTEKVIITSEPSLDKLDKALNDVNIIISHHNKKTENFDDQRRKDSSKIEEHYISTIYDAILSIDKELQALEKEVDVLTNGVPGDKKNIGKKNLILRIAANKAKISSKHKGCEMLNNSLKRFLGHKEITFEMSDDELGYKILRHNKPAKCLSEGECTAIAFIFFVTTLQDGSFDRENSIIVIDDPISSLDANSQFQAFASLKKAVSGASQVFLFTHNFDFLKLLVNWVKNAKDAKNVKSLYMVKNPDNAGHREAIITRLDSALEIFESEYHYLFNLLLNYKHDSSIGSVYLMPNIARKVLDSYLMFRIPKNASSYQRLEELKYDDEKKTAIYKFVNDQSHITGSGFDPSLVPEAQKCIGYLLDMIKETFPEHYDYLVEATTASNTNS